MVPAGSRRRYRGGMVTAETAVVLPVLLFVLAGAVAAVTVLGAQLRCVDAPARARAAAGARTSRRCGRSWLPGGAATGSVSVTRTGRTRGRRIRTDLAARRGPAGRRGVDEATARLEPVVPGAGAGWVRRLSEERAPPPSGSWPCPACWPCCRRDRAVGAAVVARHRAGSAVDLAALAAADGRSSVITTPAPSR